MKIKQLAVGIIIGAVLMFSGQAMAESISKIGKRVQGEYAVRVDGVKIEAKGLSIDGQTTVPARALADAIGYSVAFKNNEVVLIKKEQEASSQMQELERRKLQDVLNETLGDIEGVEFSIRQTEGQLLTGSFGSEAEKGNTEKRLAEYKTKLEELQKKKVELEAQLK